MEVTFFFSPKDDAMICEIMLANDANRPREPIICRYREPMDHRVTRSHDGYGGYELLALRGCLVALDKHFAERDAREADGLDSKAGANPETRKNPQIK